MIKHIVPLCKHQDSAAKDYETTPYWHTWALLFLHWLVLALDSVNVLQTCSYWNPDFNCNNNYWACHTSNGQCRKLNWNIIILIARLVLFSDDMYITNYVTNIVFLFPIFVFLLMLLSFILPHLSCMVMHWAFQPSWLLHIILMNILLHYCWLRCRNYHYCRQCSNYIMQ